MLFSKNKIAKIPKPMSHLAYIDADEEIISVIGRLRKVADTEICFVVPKRAIFLQSLVNLRLLEREAKKLGKKLSLVTQDEMGRALAEKVGIETKRSLEGVDGAGMRMPDASLPARLSRVDRVASPGSEETPPNNKEFPTPLHSESIGSASFFTEKESAVDVPATHSDVSPENTLPHLPPRSISLEGASSATPPPSPQSIPVRDRTPQRLTMLNSVRNEAPPERVSLPASRMRPSLSEVNRSTALPSRMPEKSPEKIPSAVPSQESSARSVPKSSFTYPAPITSLSPASPPNNPNSLETLPRLSLAPQEAPLKSEETPATLSPQGTPISRFYQNQSMALKEKPGERQGLKTVPSSEKNSGRRLFQKIVLGFVVISLFAGIGVSIVVFVPRAEVAVLVKEVVESADVEVRGQTDQKEIDVEGRIIPLRLLEIEKDITQSFPGTGKSSASDKRARGMVTISNAFGKEAQPLVATTRFESSDGKVFRLVKGMTIPGSSEKEGVSVSGTIEVEVVADKAGEDYNIEPTSFTLPGLKGSAKYEKITATSTKKFSGGGAGTGSIASVSADDVIRAKEASEKKLAELLRTEIEKDLRPDEKLLDDAILSETISSGAFPGVGSVAPSFDYRIRVSARALVFSESDMRTVSAKSLGEGVSSENMKLEYTVPRPDFAAKSLLVKARVSGVKGGQTIDAESLKNRILGKSVGDVQGIFADYPDIQKIEVVFWPKFMTSRIPSRASQVKMTVREVPANIEEVEQK